MTFSTISRHWNKAALLTATLGALFAGCMSSTISAAGDAARGEKLAVQYGCAACHAIPRMPTQGMVGPPLRGVGERLYLAGRLPNTPENMIRWIRFPREVDPGTLMPNMDVTEIDGRDLAAFLYSLR